MTSPSRPISEHPKRRHLDVRVCRTFAEDGNIATNTSIFCPRQERSLPSYACSTCKDSGGLHLEPAEPRTTMVCQWPGGEEEITPAGEMARIRDALPPDPTTPIATIMSTDVICVRPETSIQELVTLLLVRGISGVPVVDETGVPVGMVSKTDLLRAEQEEDDTEEMETARPRELTEADLEAGFHIHEAKRGTVGAIMTPVVLMLHESSNVGQAASLMAYDAVHRIPVVSDDRKIVGILSTMDILRWLGFQSGYIIPRRHPHRNAFLEEEEEERARAAE